MVLLEDNDVEAGLVEPVGGGQAGHASADHRDPVGPIRRQLVLAPRGRAQVLTDAELLAQQLEVVVDRRAPGRELEQPTQLVHLGRRSRSVAVVPEPYERIDCELAGLSELVLRQPGCRVHQDRQVGAQVVGDEVEVAERGGEGGEQRRHLGVLDGSADGVVVGGGEVTGEVGHLGILARP